ncbi:MAG: hypothetical protein C4288_14095 [Leptolyngbya sp. ERB_1_1]
MEDFALKNFLEKQIVTSVPLIGIQLLRGYDLRIQAIEGGLVTIVEVEPGGRHGLTTVLERIYSGS